MAVTIYDVAALAGVSPATVSRVLNGSPVSPEKTRKVREAAQALRFTPSRTARTLRKGGSDVIALVIPDVENVFFTALARGVEDRAIAAGYSVVLCNTDERPDKEARYLDIAAAQQVAGVVLAAAGPGPDLDALRARGIAVVAVDRPLPDLGVDVVRLDDADASGRATECLYGRGYTRVACVTGFAGSPTARLRAQGWRAVFESWCPGLDPDVYLRETDYRPAGGRRAAEELMALAEPPDAIFAANNMTGAGVLSHLAAVGRTPPWTGLAVLGDLPWPEWEARQVAVQPWPGRLLGVTAAEALLGRIRGDDAPPRSVILRSDSLAAPSPVGS